MKLFAALILIVSNQVFAEGEALNAIAQAAATITTAAVQASAQHTIAVIDAEKDVDLALIEKDREEYLARNASTVAIHNADNALAASKDGNRLAEKLSDGNNQTELARDRIRAMLTARQIEMNSRLEGFKFAALMDARRKELVQKEREIDATFRLQQVNVKMKAVLDGLANPITMTNSALAFSRTSPAPQASVRSQLQAVMGSDAFAPNRPGAMQGARSPLTQFKESLPRTQTL